DLARSGDEVRKRLEIESLGVARDFEDAADEAESWGRALGSGGGGSGARSLELGRRLARNPKLRKLSRLLGRMREQALALRHRLFERRDEEVFDVTAGRDLGRLLPQEMLAISHPTLHRDWQRRYVEGELLQYHLRGNDERGRGPMVVCLDVSSSMAGEKEIWSKAVTLTLLDIARRERRRFRAILFSSAETGLKTFDLNRGERYLSDLSGALDLADYFPGGGTDFERPLDAALECLGESRFRRGDVILVTDGECRVGEEWRERFLAEKKRLDFSLYSILIDVGGSAVETLAALSDRVSRVSDLTADGVKELFVRV
ncbi:MAG: VWA domain-containing protein, partial [Candidatus Binatia bacterium]